MRSSGLEVALNRRGEVPEPVTAARARPRLWRCTAITGRREVTPKGERTSYGRCIGQEGPRAQRRNGHGAIKARSATVRPWARDDKH